MEPKEPEEIIEEPSIVTPVAGLEAEEYVARELIRVRKALRATQIASVVLVLFVVVSMGSITNGFARSLEPNEAATIAKGLVDEHVNDQIPEFKRYIKEKIPTLIAEVPNYVKKQLPIYRTNLESQLEANLDQYADQTSRQLQDRFDAFLASNQSSVQDLIQNGQDPEATKNLDSNLRQMFVDYLNTTQINGESVQSKIDQTLEGLTEVDIRMKKLASNKNLTDDEKKARKAIAVLLKSVDTNPNIAQARNAVSDLRANGPAQLQASLQGVLQWRSPDEAVFTEPGKPPVTFIRKNTSEGAKPSEKAMNRTAKPPAPPAAHPPVKPVK